MNAMKVFGKNKNVFHCIQAMAKKFKGESVIEVSQKLSDDSTTRGLFELAFNVRIYV